MLNQEARIHGKIVWKRSVNVLPDVEFLRFAGHDKY